MLPSFAVEPVVIVWPTVTKDSRNNDIRDYGPTARRVHVRGWLNPGGSSEVFDEGDVASDSWTLFLPAGAEIDSTCAVEAQAGTFQVQGEPQIWSSPTGALAHVEASLRRFLPDG
jgi:hypothetical protein